MAKVKRFVNGVQTEEGGFTFKKIKKVTAPSKSPSQNRQPLAHHNGYSAFQSCPEKTNDNQTTKESRQPNENPLMNSDIWDKEHENAIHRVTNVLKQVCKLEVKKLRQQNEDQHIIEIVKRILLAWLNSVYSSLKNSGQNCNKQEDEMQKFEQANSRMCRLQQKIDLWKGQKARYAAEEQSWAKMIEKSEAFADPFAAAKVSLIPRRSVEEENESSFKDSLLEQEALAARRSIELQIDGLQSMLEGVEDTCYRAEELCEEITQDLHEEMFKILPAHTPRTLIRRIAGSDF